MRILTVGAIKGGSIPIGRAIHSAFKANGIDADFLDYSDWYPELQHLLSNPDPEISSAFLERCKARLYDRVKAFKPNVLIGIAQSPLNDISVLTDLRKMGIILCYWFVEDCALFRYWQKIAPAFDHFFLIQKAPYITHISQLGCRNVHYLPTAFDTTLENREILTEPKINLSFMGAPYANRMYYFKELNRPDFEIYGEGWSKKDHPRVRAGGCRMSGHDARRIYRRTLININLHSSPDPTSFSRGDFVNPRTFELAGLGAFQLTDFRQLLPLHFDPGSEIVTFNAWEDMKRAIDYFLEHETERLVYAQNARRRIFKEHTYQHRAREILRVLGNSL